MNNNEISNQQKKETRPILAPKISLLDVSSFNQLNVLANPFSNFEETYKNIGKTFTQNYEKSLLPSKQLEEAVKGISNMTESIIRIPKSYSEQFSQILNIPILPEHDTFPVVITNNKKQNVTFYLNIIDDIDYEKAHIKITIEYFDNDFETFIKKYFEEISNDSSVHYEFKQDFIKEYDIKNTLVFILPKSVGELRSISLTNIIPPTTEPNFTDEEYFYEMKKHLKIIRELFFSENVKIIYTEEYTE